MDSPSEAWVKGCVGSLCFISAMARFYELWSATTVVTFHSGRRQCAMQGSSVWGWSAFCSCSMNHSLILSVMGSSTAGDPFGLCLHIVQDKATMVLSCKCHGCSFGLWAPEHTWIHVCEPFGVWDLPDLTNYCQGTFTLPTTNYSSCFSPNL